MEALLWYNKKGDKAEEESMLEQDKVIEKYKQLNSLRKTAKHFNTSVNNISKILKGTGVVNEAPAQCFSNRGDSWRKQLSEHAKSRKGKNNSFYGKKHDEFTKKKISEAAKKRTGERNPNYRHGNYKRRTKDHLISEFSSFKTACFERDNYTCKICNKRGGLTLNAHHKIPYWVCQDSYFDLDNLMTCCKSCHKDVAHKGDYARFNVDLIEESLIIKYNLHRERLNELADFKNKKKSDAIVRSSDINKTEESDRNDQTY